MNLARSAVPLKAWQLAGESRAKAPWRSWTRVQAMVKRAVCDAGGRMTMKHLGSLPSLKSWQAVDSNSSGALSRNAKDIHGRAYAALS